MTRRERTVSRVSIRRQPSTVNPKCVVPAHRVPPTDCRLIFTRYLKGMLIIDFLAAFPFNLVWTGSGSAIGSTVAPWAWSVPVLALV